MIEFIFCDLCIKNNVFVCQGFNIQNDGNYEGKKVLKGIKGILVR